MPILPYYSSKWCLFRCYLLWITERSLKSQLCNARMMLMCTPWRFKSSPLKISHPKRKAFVLSHHFSGGFPKKWRTEIPRIFVSSSKISSPWTSGRNWVQDTHPKPLFWQCLFGTKMSFKNGYSSWWWFSFNPFETWEVWVKFYRSFPKLGMKIKTFETTA